VRRDVVVLLGVLGLVVVPVLIVRVVRSSPSPAEMARIVTVALTAAGLAVPLFLGLVTWWWKGRRASSAPPETTLVQVASAADRLAEVMAEEWRREAAARGITKPAPVTVGWRWGPVDIAAAPADVTAPPPAGAGPVPWPDPGPEAVGVPLESGVVTRLHDEIYAQLPHGRLVLLGGPGAGKTGAMILLLLAALQHRGVVSADARDRIPVPVWLTLGGWDPTTKTLQAWATATMYRDHPYLRAADYGPNAAAELLRCGRVALFLDGLDELPPSLLGTALDRLDEQGTGVRIVLTSRPTAYRDALAGGWLHNAAVTEVRPVDSVAAGDYLLREQVAPQRDRWEQVVRHLQEEPDSVTARALDNPLTLSLTRAIYRDADPTELTDLHRFPTTVALREHLLEQVLVNAYPDEADRAHATRWLAWIAHHMGTSRDLAWWDIPTWIPRWRLGLAVAIVFGLVGGLAGGFAGGLVSGLADGRLTALFVGILGGALADGLTAGLAAGLGFGLRFGLLAGFRLVFAMGIVIVIVRKLGFELGADPAFIVVFLFVLVFGLAAGIKPGRQPRVLIPHWPVRHQIPELIRAGRGLGLASGVVAGLAFGIVAVIEARLRFGLEIELATGLRFGLVSGLGFGLLIGLQAGLVDLWGAPLVNAAAATPDGIYRTDRRTRVVVGITVGITVGVAVGLAFGIGFRAELGMAELWVGLVMGLNAALLAGLAAGQEPLLLAAGVALTVTRKGRVHFRTLLRNAHDQQVLRQAGAVYQFRHAELQDHLARIHRAQYPPGRRRSSTAADVRRPRHRPRRNASVVAWFVARNGGGGGDCRGWR
jgi:hypothetical protein